MEMADSYDATGPMIEAHRFLIGTTSKPLSKRHNIIRCMKSTIEQLEETNEISSLKCETFN
jgi:hypothetical protein